MGKINLLLLVSFTGIVAGQEIPYAIAIIGALSAIACVVPLVCMCTVIGLVFRLLQLQRKLREANHARFEEHDYELSLNDCNTKSYKRVSNVYVKMETEMDSKKNSSEADAQSDVITKDPNNENSPSLITSEVRQYVPLDIEIEQTVDDSIYEVMTSPRGCYKGEVTPSTK